MRRVTLLVGLLLSCSGVVAGACEHPPLVAIPAKEDIGDQVAEILHEMRRYADGMTDYVGCVQAELNAAGGDAASDLQKTLLIQRNNAAVQEAKIIADLFEDRVGPIESLRLAEFVGTQRNSCISAARLHRTEVVDDRVVLFYERNGRVYLNVLEHTCPGLQRNRMFTYQPQEHWVGGLRQVGIEDRVSRVTRLCHTDFIYSIGPSFGSNVGHPCALGWFFPVSKQDAAALLTPPRERARIVIISDAEEGDERHEPE